MARLDRYINNNAGYQYSYEEIQSIQKDIDKLVFLIPNEQEGVGIESLGNESTIITLNAINRQWGLGVEEFLEYEASMEADDEKKANIFVRIWRAIVDSIKALIEKVKGWFGFNKPKLDKAVTEAKEEVKETKAELVKVDKEAKTEKQEPLSKDKAEVVEVGKSKPRVRAMPIKHGGWDVAKFYKPKSVGDETPRLPMSDDYIQVEIKAVMIETIVGQFITEGKTKFDISDLKNRVVLFDKKIGVRVKPSVSYVSGHILGNMSGLEFVYDEPNSGRSKDIRLLKSLSQNTEILGYESDVVGINGVAIRYVNREERGETLVLGIRDPKAIHIGSNVAVRAKRSEMLDYLESITKAIPEQASLIDKSQKECIYALNQLEADNVELIERLKRDKLKDKYASMGELQKLVRNELVFANETLKALAHALTALNGVTRTVKTVTKLVV